jgi:hypothetical protein
MLSPTTSHARNYVLNYSESVCVCVGVGGGAIAVTAPVGRKVV